MTRGSVVAYPPSPEVIPEMEEAPDAQAGIASLTFGADD
jgi:hypothetical protein